MNVTSSSRPPAPQPHDSVAPQTGSGLGAALALSDERSSLVVLQGDNLTRATHWLSPDSGVGQLLVGQQSLCILLQQPGEDLAHLQRRVRERLASLETPPQRLLWIAPDDALGQRLLRLYATLTQHCGPEREVLLVTRDQLLSVKPFSIAGGVGGEQAPEAVEFDGAEEITRVQGIDAHCTPEALARHSSAPPRSEVQWSLPDQPQTLSTTDDDGPRCSVRSIR